MLRLCSLRSLPLTLTLLALAACGGSGGGSGGDGGGGGDNGPPTASIEAFGGNVYVLPGDDFLLSFTADDAGTAAIRVVMDVDGDLDTTGDQILVFGPVPDASGTLVNQRLTVPLTTATGQYHVGLIADDGTHPPVTAMLANQITVIPALAGIHPSAGSNHYAVIDARVYFARNESSDGNQPLSGDGLADGDSVVARYNTNDGILTQGAVTVDDAPINGGESQIFANNAIDTVGFETNEADEGTDIDADGSQLDRVASFWRNQDATSTRTTDTGLLGLHGFEGSFLQGQYAEAQQGPGGTNRNVFGFDVDTLDTVNGFVQTEFGAPSGAAQFQMWPLAAAPSFGSLDQNFAFFPVPEADHGALDFSGDGDTADTVLAIVDFSGSPGAPGTIRGFAGQQMMPALMPRPIDSAAGIDGTGSPADLVGYYLFEPGIPGDPNGDGNFAGYVPTFYDLTGMQVMLPAPSPGQMTASPGEPVMHFQESLLWFCMNEALRAEGLPGTNNDADGGADLRILCWSDVSQGAAAVTVPLNVTGGVGMGTLQGLSLDGGSLEPLSNSWLGLEVQENANGNQDINGNGVIDSALLLIDSSVIPPVVHNPQLHATGAGNIPATGLGFDTGVLVRVIENLNGGDLDADGNGAETLLAWIRFGTPIERIFLDAGGDYAHVAGSFIGVTANETLTASDYDGNGAQSDFVFRVFDLSGQVLHGGTLSHPMSVPTSNIGTVWAFLRDEAAEARDMNSDGDQTDVILGLWRAP